MNATNEQEPFPMAQREIYKTVSLPSFMNYFAPDGSQISLLKEGERGGLCECTLGPGAVTAAVQHKVVEELWYVVSGSGQLWRQDNEETLTVDIRKGDSLAIPVGVPFQFRAGLDEPLVMLLTTMPGWGNELDADGPITVEGAWGPNKPPVAWQIQWDWWQFAIRPDGSKQLALLQVARLPSGNYRMFGRSYDEEWVERATFTSDDGHLDDHRIFTYSWRGYIGPDTFSGTGVVRFAEDTNSATGFYDIVGRADDGARMGQAVAWSRRGGGEVLDELTKRGADGFREIVASHF